MGSHDHTIGTEPRLGVPISVRISLTWIGFLMRANCLYQQHYEIRRFITDVYAIQPDGTGLRRVPIRPSFCSQRFFQSTVTC